MEYSEIMPKKIQSKRVNIVSIKLVRENSILYEPRRISSPIDAVNLCRRFLEDLDKEECIVITLDTRHQPTSVSTFSRGSLNASIVHPREVFKTAILSNSNGIIVAHNHPSGYPKPSSEDIAVTKRLIEAGEIVGIKVLDHIIIGSEGKYTSLKEENII